MSDKSRSRPSSPSKRDHPELESARRLDELRERVGSASRLIGELRESNYALSGEVAALKSRLDALQDSAGDDSPRAATSSAESSDPAPAEARLEAKLAVLQDERRAIRSRVKALLERIEEIEAKL